MEEVCRVAERHNLPVIEDAAQAIGAGYRSRLAGTLGDIACFSFYPTKNLGGFGDGGMLTTNSHDWPPDCGYCAFTAWSRATITK